MPVTSFSTRPVNLSPRCVTTILASTSMGQSKRTGPSFSGQRSGAANGAVWYVAAESPPRRRSWEISAAFLQIRCRMIRATCRPNPGDPTATICDPFPGNKIPANRLSPVGLVLLRVYSDPNNPGEPRGQNWIAAPKAPIDTRQDLIRGNVNITNKADLMIRWMNEDWVRGTQIFGDSGFPTVDSDWAQLSKSLA